MRKIMFLCLNFIIFNAVFAQKIAKTAPKLVVGIMVDQMRWDFLYRYSDRYTNTGFKKLLKEGFSCENTFINYTPTYTAPGHASVYTGSVPSLHGIIGNNWYSKELKRNVYCTEDTSVVTVGSSSTAGKQSPRNMWSTSITDELKLSNNFRSKTIGIALKDRGAILPAGHTANAAYWFDNSVGGWITSTYYMNSLPGWVDNFNNRKLPDNYLRENWNTLFPINTYLQSTEDVKPYEGVLPGEDNSFLHNTANIAKNKYESFRFTPSANTYTFEMAKAAIEGEGLGQRNVTDFLAVSFSTPDYIGHAFGPNSIEVEDMYLRLDRDLSAFLQYLDKKIGKGNYLIFLTADHGVAHIPAFMNENKMPAGVTAEMGIRQQVGAALQKEYNVADIVSYVINSQIYLNDSIIEKNKLDRSQIKQTIISTIIKHPGISKAFDLENLGNVALPEKVRTMVVNGYNQKLSGDIQYIFKPQWFDGWNTGTTHGVWHPYDAHIPLVWFGWNIKPGKLHREVYMSDIAPTLAALLKIQMPNAAIGNVIEEVIK